MPDVLLGDAGRLRQVLINYINNGIKFTEHGEVVAHVTLSAQEETRVRLRIEVRDTGVGIPFERQ